MLKIDLNERDLESLREGRIVEIYEKDSGYKEAIIVLSERKKKKEQEKNDDFDKKMKSLLEQLKIFIEYHYEERISTLEGIVENLYKKISKD